MVEILITDEEDSLSSRYDPDSTYHLEEDEGDESSDTDTYADTSSRESRNSDDGVRIEISASGDEMKAARKRVRRELEREEVELLIIEDDDSQDDDLNSSTSGESNIVSTTRGGIQTNLPLTDEYVSSGANAGTGGSRSRCDKREE